MTTAVPPAASSEIERAATLSRALSNGEPVPPSPDALPRLAAPAELHELRLEPPVGARWPALAEWLRATFDARAVVVMNEAGLLVTAAAIDDEQATRIGGHLALACECVQAIGSTSWLTTEVDGELVTALALERPEEATVLVAVMGHARALPHADIVRVLGTI